MFDKYTLSAKNGKTSVEISVFNRKDVEMKFFVKCPDSINKSIDKDFLKSFKSYLRQVVFQGYGQVRKAISSHLQQRLAEFLTLLYI